MTKTTEGFKMDGRRRIYRALVLTSWAPKLRVCVWQCEVQLRSAPAANANTKAKRFVTRRQQKITPTIQVSLSAAVDPRRCLSQHNAKKTGACKDSMATVPASRVDAMQAKLREIFEVKSGYKDDVVQAKLLERHFKQFDTDGSGVIDFDEFSRAMVKLNFVGVQAEVEALFDRFDEDLNGVISYGEFAQGVFGQGGKMALQSNSLLGRVREKILDAGGKNGIRTLGVILRRMDQNGNGVIELEEFQEGLVQLGMNNVDPGELERVFRFFDADQSGKITLNELLRGLRGFMAKRRIKIVKEAFSRLDTSGDGVAMIDEIERLYDPSHHPEVLAGRLRPRDALLEFMRVFEESHTKDGTITWHEFLVYYKDLSAGIANDDEFELMIRNAWHISGGKGWAANSTCRRVLVTFRDGSQRVLEIENDLGVHASDKHKMIQRLTEQGFRQIVDISLAT